MTTVKGPAACALNSLSESQTKFLQNLPKGELHAHLNGSIPISCLQRLARERTDEAETSLDTVSKGLQILERGVDLDTIDNFFTLFPAIYALTSSPRALAIVTREVLSHFLLPGPEGSPPQCEYIELRSTPRATEHMTRDDYLVAVLDQVEDFGHEKAALIVSIDRRMSIKDVQECVDLAISLRDKGRRVVGVDLCGDPTVRTIGRIV
jgi:adenosine deaminase